MAYSTLMDASPKFYQQTWIWVHSLLQSVGVPRDSIYLQYTDSVDPAILAEFRPLGINLIAASRFGDRKYCNKISQLDAPQLQQYDCVFLMDADTFVFSDVSGAYDPNSLAAKVVDLANPPLAELEAVFQAAGFAADDRPEIIGTTVKNQPTYSGNLNGGFYAIPGKLIPELRTQWRHWAEWLLSQPQLMPNCRKHIDQVSLALSLHKLGVKPRLLDASYNYPLHQRRAPSIDDVPKVIHYHDLLDRRGLIAVPPHITNEKIREPIAVANELIGKTFNNRIFWTFRYHSNPGLGSGVGSRGKHLQYKRQLLLDLGVDKADSVLDVGCGDLEVLGDFPFRTYCGLDVSPLAIERAKARRPDWSFRLLEGRDFSSVPSADTVLCFEVLIHQQNADDYQAVIDLAVQKTQKRLVISGYEDDQTAGKNHMIKFYEPLSRSLAARGVFASIRKVGGHTDVDILLAEK